MKFYVGFFCITLFACFSQMSVAGDKEQYRRESYFKLNVDCNHDNVGNSHSKDSITFRLFSPYKELWSKKLVIKADTSSTNLLTQFNAT